MRLNPTRYNSSFVNRPLLCLLPFFMVGAALGPDLAECSCHLWPAALLAAFTLLLWAATGREVNLVPVGLVFALIGAASSTSTFTPPPHPAHILHLQGRLLVFGGQVSEPPLLTHGRTRVLVDVTEYLEIGGQPRPAWGQVVVTIPGDRPSMVAGDRVRFPAVLRSLSSFGNPGGYDFRRHQIGNGVWASTFLKDDRMMVVIEEPEKRFSIGSVMIHLRTQAAGFLDQTLGQPALGLMKALLLGRMDEIETDVQESFRVLGLSHILSISGLHIGLVAWLAYGIIRWLLLLIPNLALRIDVRRLASVLAMGPVILYTGLAGGSPSVTRSTIMVGTYLLAQLVDRLKDPLTALATAAWIILLINPAALFTPSFQLSFAAAGAIILLAARFPWSPFRTPLPGEDHKPRTGLILKAWGLAITTLAATLGTALIAVYHFHHLPLLSLPANLIFTPIINLVFVPPGLAALGLATVWPGAAGLLFQALEIAWWLILPSMNMMAGWPGINPLMPTPGWKFFVYFYSLTALIFCMRPWRRALIWLGAVTTVYLLSWGIPYLIDLNQPRLQVTILDVGQGSSAYVRFPDHRRLIIDGGGFPGAEFDPGGGDNRPFSAGRRLSSVGRTGAVPSADRPCRGIGFSGQGVLSTGILVQRRGGRYRRHETVDDRGQGQAHAPAGIAQPPSMAVLWSGPDQGSMALARLRSNQSSTVVKKLFCKIKLIN
ncbi:MAG: ComEC/Rec2 family competence protein, partial [Deltaproteobacteria bacterium]|nr:ComEC/Rec2 family competence protein [Deltaproteobacteria bacterium]